MKSKWLIASTITVCKTESGNNIGGNKDKIRLAIKWTWPNRFIPMSFYSFQYHSSHLFKTLITY